MICALIKYGIVQSIGTADDEAGVRLLSDGFDLTIDITDAAPQPAVGWLLLGNVLVSNGSSGEMKITKLGMLQRFTVSERLAILAYIQSNAASVPAILMQNLTSANYVDLSRYDTKSGINYLVLLSLLTSDRASVILTTPPTALEVYRP